MARNPYTVAQEIRSETKMSKNIYLFDFFFLLMYMCVSLMLSGIVHPKLRLLFLVFSFVMALFLTMRSSVNKKRRNYESVILMLRRDRMVYRPVINISKKPPERRAER